MQIPESQADFAYTPGKWTVKQVLQHCIDTERIFSYRALCIARGEQQPLPGFDQDVYAQNADVNNKSLQFLKNEMILIRESSILLFTHFADTELNRMGTVSNYSTTVLALGFNIVGHWLHHYSILTEKYGIASKHE
ncbi:MAG: DinB family protein [Niabella sp.]